MDDAKREKIKSVLRMIADDAERDVKHFEGKPFTGKNVATYFGYHAAAIKSLAEIIEELV